tara:strand:- start:21532 stop:22755 length:1224 start_codon:yes stop_codon:yes gene_type:complete
VADDIFGFDRADAEKIAKVVRNALNSQPSEKSHRRADVSGPGNRVTIGMITEGGGNTHKFIFVAGSYNESVGNNTAEFLDIPDEYYAHDLCGEKLGIGDHVWLVDHNNQWWIIDRCTRNSGTGPAGGACCGSCGGGTITTCAACSPAQPTYTFDLGVFGGRIPDDPDCCDELWGSHFVWHESGCTWEGEPLYQCCEHPTGGDPPKWTLTVLGTDPYDVTLKVELDTDCDGVHDATVSYSNPFPFCCDCANAMRLTCPDNLPTGCDTMPCEICLLPGPKCCATSKLTKNLKATISNSSGCPCADGVVIDLWWRPATQDWYGSGLFCHDSITGDYHYVDLTLTCDVDGGDCQDFRLDVSFQDACNSGGTFSPTVSCDCEPLNLPFDGLAVDGCCGASSTGATVTIVVTE